MPAPQAIARLLTTFVMAMSPMFCAKEVRGEQPKQPASTLVKPSAATAPESSRSEGLRPKVSDETTAESPRVSAMLTKYSSTTVTMAPALNSGMKGMMCGRATGEMPAKPLKSTLPRHRASA